jgi:hypothetical protein
LYYLLANFFRRDGEKWDRMAVSEEAAVEFAHEYVNPEPQRMLASGRYSPEYCLASSAETINERYRSGESPNEAELAISEMISAHSTKRPIILYRGVCDHVFEQMIENAQGVKNADLLEKGFLSTSLVRGREIRCERRLRIYVPQGTAAVYLGNVNDEQFYYEVVVQHGAHLKVLSKDKTYLNCILLGTA